MYEYIVGDVKDLTPTQVIIDNGGIGYAIQISLQTYAALDGKSSVKLYIHQIVREDAHILYGFMGLPERELFRHLIGVSGIGANTARVILSSYAPQALEQIIAQGDVDSLKQVKGIGLKTAQRVVIELRDKLGKGVSDGQIFLPESNTKRQEALSALVMLGFAKGAAEKTINLLLKQNPNETVENLIKDALKGL